MIDLYYWPTPNGHKVSIALEEIGLEYRILPVNIQKGEQFAAEFLVLNPNNRIPTIVDHDGPGGRPFAVFESVAILLYLAEKSNLFWPSDSFARSRVTQWLLFQAASLGPMFGQCGHFLGYAPEIIPYAIQRYQGETLRLYGLLDRELSSRDYITGDDYSLADMATYPWFMPAVRKLHEIDVTPYANIVAWIDRVGARPAVRRGTALMSERMKFGDPDEETRSNFFQQGLSAGHSVE